MSDRDKLVVLGLFFIFLISFFVLFILLGDIPDSKLFQYMFFIAALTMAFTGFLGATGTFATQGQTLGGGAAIFLVMVVAVVGLKPHFATDNLMLDIVEIAKYSPTEELTADTAVKRIKSTIEEVREVQQVLKIDTEAPLGKIIARLKASLSTTCAGRDLLRMKIISATPPYRVLQTTDGKVNVYIGERLIESKEGKYELPVAELRKSPVTVEIISKDISFNLGGGAGVFNYYDDSVPELQLYYTKEVK